jgi:hypothetical protein
VTQFEKNASKASHQDIKKKNYGKKTASHDSDDADFK